MKYPAITAIAMLAASAPAGAITILNNTAQLSAADINHSFIVNTDGSTANSDGLFGKIVFTLKSVAAAGSGTEFKFDYRIENRSVAPAASSRLGQFGFDISGTPGTGLTVANVTGDYFSRPGNNNGNFNGLGNREVCLTVPSNNCNGGNNSGILSGFANSKAGQLIFTYANATQTITFSNFVTRWQAGQNGDSASGGGTVVTAVPEPATWAMMIGGFGLAGAAMRRRRAATVSFA